MHHLLACLKNLEKFKMTQMGLQSFMMILNMYNPNLEDELLTKLYQVAMQVRKLKCASYATLRS